MNPNPNADTRIAKSLLFMNTFFGAPLVDPNAIRLSEGNTQDHGRQTNVAWMEHHVRVNPETAISSETRQQIVQSKRNHMPMRINAELNTIITNTVHSTELVDVTTGMPYRLPLNEIICNLLFLGSQSNTQRFAKIVQRYGPDKRLTQLIFSTGKIVETGPLSFEAKRAQIHALVELMRASGLVNLGIGVRMCQNIVSTGLLTFRLRLWVLLKRFGQYVTFDPVNFAGATIRHPALTSLLADNEDVYDVQSDLIKQYDDGTKRRASMFTSDGQFISIDSAADEVLDNPEAMRNANEYAHQYMERMGNDMGDMKRMLEIVEERLAAQKAKNIVALAFGNGVFIIGGTKNVRMLRRAHAIVYEMADYCRDTPENEALEKIYLQEHGLNANGTPLVPPQRQQHQPHRQEQQQQQHVPKPIAAVPALSTTTPQWPVLVKRGRGRPRKQPGTVPLQGKVEKQKKAMKKKEPAAAAKKEGMTPIEKRVVKKTTIIIDKD